MSTQIKAVVIEDILKQDEFLTNPKLTQAEITTALDDVIRKIDINMEYFKEKFPWSATRDLLYPIIENVDWTEGFWTGQLWLAYEYTGDAKYKDLAMLNVRSFRDRLDRNIELEHHDLGFLYSLSCVAAYKITGDEFAKETAVLAADKLMTRWQEKGEFIQAWGEYNNPEHYRFIIDCLLNIPLLYWASEVTGDMKYDTMARKHFATSVKYVVRSDASAYHTFYMNPVDGSPVRGATRQGYSDDSSWARGQAWAIYGIPLNIRYTHDTQATDLYIGMTNYFLNRLPKDNVPFWDLIFTDGDDQSRDSSAAAIAACGMMEMNNYLSDDALKSIYDGAVHTMMRSLINNYTEARHNPGNPIIYHGVYSWHSGKGVDQGNIWGDYFYLEALMRLHTEWNPYW
ncbi:glucuronyl hydrolase [Erysipelothrix sp. HDW6C]|uniref:glycoside hydrolase family 88 protein n=1 Tax=Erysipelothrix sp. HDW6C TaxID=2714930 RepID=UPI0014096EC7|nr:glycoside hydrolase family 88 protein [Erysipelothrix sp. HDW6C]QIK69281.1 glucuronyl hydrolase [Erysipelothrix sp. HDW6C]